MTRYLIGLFCLIAFTVPATVEAATVVADYRDDFSPTIFPDNWTYQWNAPSGWNGSSTPAGNGNTGGLFSLGDYEPLASTGTRWTVDGDTNSGNGSPGRFLTLTSTGGHPGRGSAQGEGGVGNTIDRYAIASVQVSERGFYFINDSFYTNTNPGGSNGAEVVVHVDGLQTKQTVIPNNGTQSFNHLLPKLNPGQIIHTAFGPNTTDGSDGFATDFSVVRLGNQMFTVADYQADYQEGGPADGWRFQWNAPDGWTGTSTPAGNGNTGAIGDPSNYVDLNPVGSGYRVDFDTNSGNGSPGRFLQLTPGGNGHPGRGSGQGEGGVGNTLDRYTVTGFQVEEDGTYAIVNSLIDPLGTAGNGGDVLIHVNGGPMLLQQFFDDSAVSFDLFLGDLVAGDVVYVAVGPNVLDGSDSFNLDFQIARFADVPEPTTALLALLGSAGLLRRRRQIA